MWWMKRLLSLLVRALGLVPITERVEAANRMYWTDAAARTIQRANLDGSGVQDLLATGAAPQGIALDVTGGRVYWVRATEYV